MAQIAQEVIFEVGIAIENEPNTALQNADLEAQNEDGTQVIHDNLPWIVKTHFDFQDMVLDLKTTEFWFQKLAYPILAFGLAVCSSIYSFKMHSIDMEHFGYDYLDNLGTDGTTFNPVHAFYLAKVNIYLFYAQTFVNVAMVIALYLKCRF